MVNVFLGSALNFHSHQPPNADERRIGANKQMNMVYWWAYPSGVLWLRCSYENVTFCTLLLPTSTRVLHRAGADRAHALIGLCIFAYLNWFAVWASTSLSEQSKEKCNKMELCAAQYGHYGPSLHQRPESGCARERGREREHHSSLSTRRQYHITFGAFAAIRLRVRVSEWVYYFSKCKVFWLRSVRFEQSWVERVKLAARDIFGPKFTL